MAEPKVRHLRAVSHGREPSRLRLLAPVRYLLIRHPEKITYDIIVPFAVAVAAWLVYWFVDPKPALFGPEGLLHFARDLLIMAVPFMVGALAAVGMGSPGTHMDSKPVGVELRLDGRSLTLRQFICYMLGYLCFVGLVTLAGVVLADLMHDPIVAWVSDSHAARLWIKMGGTFALSLLLSVLTVSVFWSLYFLTDVVNRAD